MVHRGVSSYRQLAQLRRYRPSDWSPLTVPGSACAKALRCLCRPQWQPGFPAPLTGRSWAPVDVSPWRRCLRRLGSARAVVSFDSSIGILFSFWGLCWPRILFFHLDSRLASAPVRTSAPSSPPPASPVHRAAEPLALFLHDGTTGKEEQLLVHQRIDHRRPGPAQNSSERRARDTHPLCGCFLVEAVQVCKTQSLQLVDAERDRGQVEGRPANRPHTGPVMPAADPAWSRWATHRFEHMLITESCQLTHQDHV